MKELAVSIEIEGNQKDVGRIVGDSPYDAEFRYSDAYLASDTAVPISISLPLSERAFGPAATAAYFEGLLPEGFMRRSIAEQNRTDDRDYLSILEMLGAECLGAIQIKGERFKSEEPHYRLLDSKTMTRLAAEGAGKSADLVVEARLSLTGASGKIGAYKSEGGAWYLPTGSAPSTHIIKQGHIRYDHIVQNEQLVQKCASLLGIEIPESEIIEKNELMLATKRYDRSFAGSNRTVDNLLCPLRLHQEDMGQAMGIPASDKYERPGGGYMKRMFEIIRRHSEYPIEDQLKLWSIIAYHWLIGNTDGHIKNISFLYNDNLKARRLAPAYDMLSTVLYESHSTKMAFSIGGDIEWQRIDRHSFERACEESGLRKSIFLDALDAMKDAIPRCLAEAAEMLYEEGFTDCVDMAKQISDLAQGIWTFGR